MRQALYIGCMVSALLGVIGCGYGKDTGPKTPKAQLQFEPLADRLVARTQTCFEDVFQVNMGRAVSPAERGATAKVSKAMGALRTELLGCLTGKGYGNEIQLDASSVEVWLGKPGCPQFAKAAFKAAQCIAIQSVIEEAGFSPDAPAPPRQPPTKKRPGAAAPAGK